MMRLKDFFKGLKQSSGTHPCFYMLGSDKIDNSVYVDRIQTFAEKSDMRLTALGIIAAKDYPETLIYFQGAAEDAKKIAVTLKLPLYNEEGYMIAPEIYDKKPAAPKAGS